MKIAVVGTYDVTNVNFWSGTATYIYDILNKNYNVVPIEISLKRNFTSKLKGFYHNRILRKKYISIYDISTIEANDNHVSKFFKDEYDLIVTFEFFLIASISKYAKNVILISDATFDNLLNYYDYQTNLCSVSIRDGHLLQKEAFNKSIYSLFSSQWAIENATIRYNVDPGKLKTLHYGSNLSASLNFDEVEAIVEKRHESDEIYLFFPALYWERKGGDYAIEVVSILNQKGFNVKLIIAGCNVPGHIKNDYIINVGFLNKKKPEQELKLMDWYKKAHFLILPSNADCTPIVFSEANSFAMPVITSTTGGIESIINQENNNGIAIELNNQFSEKAADYVIESLENPELYLKICKDSYKAYKEKLDWSIGENQLIGLIDKIAVTDSLKTKQ